MRFADILMVAATAPCGRAVDADALLWNNAVISNGGSVSAGRLTVVNAFVVAEKAAGTWALTDDYWALWGENAVQSLTSLKQRRLATSTATFQADRGYTSDGASTYIDTGFIPFTHASIATASNVGAAAYVRTNINNSTLTPIGVQSSSNRIIRIVPRNVGDSSMFANTSTGAWTLPAADSRGYTSVSRNGAAGTDAVAHKNGSILTRIGTPANVGASLPIVALALCAHNNAGVPANFYTGQVSFGRFGAALTTPQEASHYTNVQTWATAIGAQV